VMHGSDKALISVYAADEVGEHKLQYQQYHTLIFYLAKVGHFKFPDYSFSPFLWGKAGNALISRELARDTGVLLAKGYLTLNSPAVSITPSGVEVALEAIPRLEEDEGEDRGFDKLKQVVKSALKSQREDPGGFLRVCYRAYVEGLQ
jgi:hypothetical protein